MKRDYKKLFVCLSLPFIAAFSVLAVFGFCSITADFFANLKRPFLFPNQKLFCLLWGFCCLTSGFAAYRILCAAATYENRKNSLSSFVISLFFYFLWAVVFFGLKEFYFSTLWFLALAVFVVSSVKNFKKVDAFASKLLLPQIVLTLYTAYLNLGFALLN